MAQGVVVANRIWDVDVVIASGEALSGIADGKGGRLVGLNMPDGWTAADIIFYHAGPNDGTYNKLVNDAGITTKITSVAADVCIAPEVNLGTLSCLWNFKIKSVSTSDESTGVNQAAERTIKLIFQS